MAPVSAPPAAPRAAPPSGPGVTALQGGGPPQPGGGGRFHWASALGDMTARKPAATPTNAIVRSIDPARWLVEQDNDRSMLSTRRPGRNRSKPDHRLCAARPAVR